MTIREALKSRNILYNELGGLYRRLQWCNTYRDGYPQDYNSIEVIQDIKQTIEEITDLKARIMIANQGNHARLVKMAELKKLYAELGTMPTTSSKETRVNNEGEVICSHLTREMVDDLLNDINQQMKQMRKEIEDYNEVTELK